MAKHHGMTALSGMHAFCNVRHVARAGDRFGRLFHLPPLWIDPEHLVALGAPGGGMDGGAAADRTDSVDVGQVFFGQFVDHDITLDTTSSLSGVAVPEEIRNVRTPTLDLDCVYGDGPEASPHLYHASGDFAGVKLLTGADGTAAPGQPTALAQEDLCRTPHGTAIIGDPRNDENRIISQLQLAMIRFHNRVVDHLYTAGETEELFEHARELCTWHYQWVVIHDFVASMCGGAVVDDVLGRGRRFYCPDNGAPFIPMEFSVAAYRFGHSMIPQRIQIQPGGSSFKLFGATLGIGFQPLADSDAVVNWGELVETGSGQVVQKAEKLDTQMASDLLDLPFIPSGVTSLAARNLLRGQAFLLPSGESVARAMERDESEIDRVRDRAVQVAGSGVDLSAGVPLWFYILAEAEEVGRETAPGDTDEGEGLGPVGARIVAETLIGLCELDSRSFLSTNRSWHPNKGVGVATLGDMLTF